MSKTDNIKVKYRYTITMPDRIGLYSEIINKWLSLDHFEKLYNGKLLLLVSPKFSVNNKDYSLYQIQLDVEGFDTKKSFNFCKSFCKDNSGYYFCYTGRSGFHIYSKFVVKMKNDLSISEIRNMLLDKFDLPDYVDLISSIRDVPTIRIGYRPDTDRLSFPIFANMNYNEFKNISDSYKNFSFIEKHLLITFVKNSLIPLYNQIEYNQYLKY